MKYTRAILMVLCFLVSGYAAESRLGVQARGKNEYMFVSGDGKKAWYSALELEQIAKEYVINNKVEFSLEGTQRTIWVNTDGGKVLAQVWFSSGTNRPSLEISIGRKGNVLKHKITEPEK